MYASSGRKTRTIDVLAKHSRRMPPKGHPPFLSIAHKGGDAGLTPCIHTALKFSCSGRQSSPWILFWDRTDGLSYEPDVVAAADQAWIEAHAERKSKVRIEGRRPIEAVGPEPVMDVVDLICNAENKKQLPVTLWAKLLTIQKITKFSRTVWTWVCGRLWVPRHPRGLTPSQWLFPPLTPVIPIPITSMQIVVSLGWPCHHPAQSVCINRYDIVLY